jgi:hypothetical protein
MTDEQLKTIHAQNARAFNERAERERAARRTDQAQGNPLPAHAPQPEIKHQVSDAEKEIKRLQSHAGGGRVVKVLTAEQHDARVQHILNIANSNQKENSMSKPEPSPVVIAEKARDYMAQQHAKGNKFYSIGQAVAHVRQEMGLSNDTLATDADMTRRAHAQD